MGVLPSALLLAGLLPATAAASTSDPTDPAWVVDDGTPVEVEPGPDQDEARDADGDRGRQGRHDAVRDDDRDDDADEEDDEEDDDGFVYGLHGYYRARTHVIGNQMYPREPAGERLQTLRFVTQRLRLQPSVGYGDWITLHLEIDALDNIVWGDNAGLSSTPLFASDLSQTGLDGSERPYVNVHHAWIESMLPVGVLRVGRQPSEWGLGLLSNDGEGFDDEFGDNRYGDVNDRILFATKPISIVRALAGMESIDTPLVLAVAWEKLVESFLETDRTRPAYDSGWLAGDDDDVDEWVVALAWDQDDLQWLGDHDSLKAGFYFVYREQPSTSSQIFIYDAFLALRLWDFFLEGEFDLIRGSTCAIPFGPEDPDTGLYPYKEADILGWLLRAGWSRGMFTVKLEAGYASGDADPSDTNFSNRALAPDVNVGLILYEELLAQRTREAWRDNGGMWSNGGVYNSWYFMATGIVEPLPRLQFTLAILTGWSNEVCDSVFQGIDCADQGAHPNLGVELDASVRYRFYDDHVIGVLEAGWLRPDNAAFNLDPFDLNDTDMWTLQTRLAFVL